MLDARATWLAAAATAGLLIPAPLENAAAQTGGRGGGGASSGFSSGPSSSFGRSTGSFTTAPSSVAPAPGALPPSAIGTPAPQVAPVAPLSPPTTSTFLGSGGTTVTTPGGITTTVTPPGGLTTTAPGVGTTATFPGGGGSSITTGSISPSESALSRPGGGAPGVQACMGFWDAGTHMSKREWAAACRRVENRLDSLKSELTASAQKTGPRAQLSRNRVSRAKSR